ncbi:MOSC domain-containing protein [Paenibacillus harenae]|uniref:MOSC domain-containing protein n=1 Tax=Paenibacillus harenae TaxID=306543 RepID=UPI002790105D|nr:MOSC domain-containing protein [Paenibacillus harenae]MDQ0057984.1 MOSC domain-containing protein YiiM [Paenibacillus harenae]
MSIDTVVSLPRVVSLNVGMPVSMAHGSKEVVSGIVKRASEQPHALSFTGLEGDGQGDTVHHGGRDKAICAYFERNLPYWSNKYDRTFEAGAFGENLTVSEWTEHDLCIGDIVQIGDVVVQVSQPRQPCYKLGLRHDLQELPQDVQLTGYTGFYFRVMKEGVLQSGSELVIVQRHPAAISIAEANRLMYIDKEDVAGLRELLAVEELSVSWQEQLGNRLRRLEQQEA